MKSKTKLPKSLTMPSIPKSGAESGTSKPAKGRSIATPRVPFAPKSPQREQVKVKV